MLVAYFPCIQSVKLTSRSHGLFSVGNYGRSNNNKRCCLVVASTKKMNDVHLELKIIYLGKKPDDPTSHTGLETCYYTSVIDMLKDQQTGGNKLALTTLYSLESTISEREAELAVPRDGKPSWTKQLLHEKLLGSKIREEADVLYHATVLLALKKVKTEDVLQVL